MQIRGRWTALLTLGALLLLAIILGFLVVDGDAPPNVPEGWELVAEEGEIASPCFGAWEECGAIERIYHVNANSRQAIEDLRSSLEEQGWTVDSVTSDSLSAMSDDKEARFYARLEDSEVITKYVKR